MALCCGVDLPCTEKLSYRGLLEHECDKNGLYTWCLIGNVIGVKVVVSILRQCK